jgi:replicative DNA helicase
MKLFYTGPVINTEMLVVMLEKHGIEATHEVLAGESMDENDLNRMAQVLVPEAHYDRAHQLFYAEREDEL